MIIGENINSEYDGYEEENYDYLFKRKNKEVRQQKKAEKKQVRQEKKQVRQEKRVEKKQVRQVKREEKKAGITPKKHPILGNFGLFNKNKKKEEAAAKAKAAAATSPGSSTIKAPAGTSDSSPVDEGTQAGGGLTALAAASLLDKTEGSNSPGSESAAEGTENTNLENKELDKNGNPKKEAGMGAIFGFVCLGIVVTVIGVVLFKSDKKSQQVMQPLRAAA